METLGRLPRIASIVAFVIAGIVILNGLIGPVVVLPFAVVPLCAGIGILRRRVWSAYGFATFFFGQLLLIPVILLRPGTSIRHATQIVEIIFWLLLGIFFLFAGRSMAASGAVRGWPLPWFVATALIVVPFFFVQTFEIPGGSMEPTVLPGDRILAQEFPRPVPERGKMALILSPTERGQVLIKRIIAGPGDRIRIANKVVILNGVALDEKYVTHAAEEHYGENFPNDEIDANILGCAEGHEMISRQVVNGEVVIPAGQYFVLGDNRENSLDSRCWGFIRSGDLIGRPLMIYDSIEPTPDQELDPDKGWPGRRRWARLFKVF